MATVCDLCRKPETAKRKMFRLIGAYAHLDSDMTILIAPQNSPAALYSNYQNAICTDCLYKLGVDQAIVEQRRRDVEREAQQPKLATAITQLPEASEK